MEPEQKRVNTIKQAVAYVKRALNGGDPTHDRQAQAKLDVEIPRQLQEIKPPTQYDYLGRPRP